MSRLKKFTASLWSGQIMLAANVVYTALSVPLALHYLGKTEFGVWAVVMQFASYLALIDGGMSRSLMRLLIDHKDAPADGKYGAMFKLSLLVSAAQGVLILLAGAALSLSVGVFFDLPPGLERDFRWLLIGQSALTMGQFFLQPWGQVLTAHQRMDVGNYVATLQLLVSLALLFVFFEQGCGLYAILYANGLGWLLFVWVCPWVCHRNGYIPRCGEYGKITRELAHEAVSYGMDLFFISLGSQLATSSQTLLVGKLMGLEAAAVWSVMTRALNLVMQVIGKVLNYAWPALTEMFVRGEMVKFKENTRAVIVLTGCLAAVGAAGLMVCNNDFNTVWTSGQIVWSWDNNVLLGMWFFIRTVYGSYSSLPFISKQLGRMKYVWLGEGVCFIGAALLWPLTMTFKMMWCLSLVTSVLFSGAYSLVRSAEIFQIKKRELLAWNGIVLLTLAVTCAVGCGAWLALWHAPALARLTVCAALIAGAGGWIILWRGISTRYAAYLPPLVRRFCKVR